MKIILPPIQTVDKICGDQRYKEGIEYRPTKHYMHITCPDGQLLYHTFTKGLLLIEKQDREQDLRNALVNNWFLVPQDFDECGQVDGVRKIVSVLRGGNRKKTSFTILTTTDCNARCFYCYEMGTRRYAMTPETARDVGEYIVQVCGGEKVRLSWFGGEPLLNSAVIDIICGVLRQNGIEYSSIMTSNGYYLDAQTAQKAVEDWHVTTTQITIDGTESVYNRTKAYVNNVEKSPYRRVLQNIETALDAGMEILIRLNMDEANANDLVCLADELGYCFHDRGNLHAHVILLQKYVGDIHAFDSRETAEQRRKALTQKLEGMGFALPERLNRRLHINHCMADNDACEVILPDGRIEKCEHIDEEQVIGDIYDSEREEAKIREWKEIIRFADCAGCELYPVCCNLALCPRTKAGCDSLRQDEFKDRIRKILLKTYLEMKANQEAVAYEDEGLFYTGGSWR